ncbi:MAG TPA: ribosome biogenesis GTP-binding protein YihA/YsxC [Gemmatimonadaceae bacterium]|nr:ribosome biogenesis GTP-binding protein YihA/YsxC [Gemmatimonadaceae bacterium]
MSKRSGTDAPSKEPRAADPLVVRSFEVLGGMAGLDTWRPETTLPEVAFAGRSNVGKSSLINRLLHRKKAARVSNTPGRTREVNFFRINDQFVLADLPGYGYARISKEAKQAWQPLIEGYLRSSPHLRGVVQLIDIRHPPTPDDHEMLGFLAEVGVPTLVAATKIDKLTRTQLGAHLAQLSAAIGMDEDQIIPFSSVTGAGRDDLAAAIVSLVADDATNDGPQSD